MTKNSSFDFKKNLPELDGLRAIAALSVLVYHIDVFPFSMEDSQELIFFVISGYVISRSIYNKPSN